MDLRLTVSAFSSTAIVFYGAVRREIDQGCGKAKPSGVLDRVLSQQVHCLKRTHAHNVPHVLTFLVNVVDLERPLVSSAHGSDWAFVRLYYFITYGEKADVHIVVEHLHTQNLQSLSGGLSSGASSHPRHDFKASDPVTNQPALAHASQKEEGGNPCW